MNEEQNIVYTQGILLQARIELEGMIAENQIRRSLGQSLAYGEEKFLALIEKYGVHHNGLLNNLTGH